MLSPEKSHIPVKTNPFLKSLCHKVPKPQSTCQWFPAVVDLMKFPPTHTHTRVVISLTLAVTGSGLEQTWVCSLGPSALEPPRLPALGAVVTFWYLKISSAGRKSMARMWNIFLVEGGRMEEMHVLCFEQHKKVWLLMCMWGVFVVFVPSHPG